MTEGNANERPKALLDSNVWRYVVDCGAQGAVVRLARNGTHTIQVAPAVVYEALRFKDVKLRGALTRLMVHPAFNRLMPEAYSESMEILREIERVQPRWLRPVPDLRFFNRLRRDWSRKSGGFWVRVARAPEMEARFLSALEGPMIEGAAEQTKNARREMINAGWKHNPSMDKTLAEFDRPTPGWRGDKVAAWRVDAVTGLTHNLAQQGNAYRDWVAPWVELDTGLLQSAGWVEFWLYLANVTAVPRQWMRWAHSFAQRFRKVTPGSPADTQLFTYLLETDLVVTADRALLDILEECRPFAPTPLPKGELIPAGRQGVEALRELLSPRPR